MTVRERSAPTIIERVMVALAVGLLAALWIRSHALSAPDFKSDFDQVWVGARALLDGKNPYLAVGPDAPFKWKWPLYYPLPALILTSPLALVPVMWARMLFGGLGAALFAFAISRDGWSRWPILLSVTFYVSVDLVQWSLFLAAAYYLPVLSIAACGKPNFGVPLLAGARDARSWIWLVVSATVLLAASFLWRASWMTEWLQNVRVAPHFIPPIARRGGFLLLLALLRWKRPEARWLFALALIPQAPSFYDQLLLVAVCTRWWETALLSLCTYVLFFFVGANLPQPDYLAWGRLVGDATVWFCFLPMLALLLFRPNEGSLSEMPPVLARWGPTRSDAMSSTVP